MSYAEAGATWWQESFAGSDSEELEAVLVHASDEDHQARSEGEEEFLGQIPLAGLQKLVLRRR